MLSVQDRAEVAHMEVRLIKRRLLTHKQNQPVEEYVINNFALDRKIKEAAVGLAPTTQWSIMAFPRDEDKELIADFILAWSNDNADALLMSTNTKKAYITALSRLSKHFEHKKSLKEMTTEDIVEGFLRSIKKEFSDDPEQKWVNTYNTYAARYLVFWKWLTQPDLRREERQTPPQVKGLRFVKHKDRRSKRVKVEDMWTAEENRVFLKYCEGSQRGRRL